MAGELSLDRESTPAYSFVEVEPVKRRQQITKERLVLLTGLGPMHDLERDRNAGGNFVSLDSSRQLLPDVRTAPLVRP